MNILLLDNYDSFTYNLVHYLEGLDCDVTVIRNDEVQVDGLNQYDKIVISPGPGLPKEAGELMNLIERYGESMPILGVCLGFQAIIEHYGGKLYNQETVKHGIFEQCNFEADSKLFKGLPANFKVGLYHSWAADADNFPAELKVTATSENDVVMAFEHKTLPLCGVQFHPESILTEHGKQIVQNFLFNFD